jgi:hypothetical protein
VQFSSLFLTVLVAGAVLMAAAGAVLLAALFLSDKKASRLW